MDEKGITSVEDIMTDPSLLKNMELGEVKRLLGVAQKKEFSDPGRPIPGGLRVYGKEPIKGKGSYYASMEDGSLPGACSVGTLAEVVIRPKYMDHTGE